MPVPSQDRPTLEKSAQQADATLLASMVALQVEAFTAAGVMNRDKDLALCDASGGTFTLDLPAAADVIIGKPYLVKEWEGSNLVTVRPADGDGTIDGLASLAVAAGEATTFVARAYVLNPPSVTWDVVAQTAPNPGVGGELLSVNNLNDVADADTARANIDAGRLMLSVQRIDLISASAEVYRYVHQGPDATIVSLSSAITGALATGDATITASIDGVPVTDGVLTIAQAGSAAGDVDTATPSAANVISAGETLELTVGGTQTAAEFADVSVELTY